MSLCVEMCVCAIVSIVDLPPQFQNMIFLMQAHKNHKKVKGVGKIWNASRICVSSLRRGHANLLCIVPILVYVFRGIHLESVYFQPLYHNHFTCQLFFHTL